MNSPRKMRAGSGSRFPRSCMAPFSQVRRSGGALDPENQVEGARLGEDAPEVDTAVGVRAPEGDELFSLQDRPRLRRGIPPIP